MTPKVVARPQHGLRSNDNAQQTAGCSRENADGRHTDWQISPDFADRKNSPNVENAHENY